jgi:predicted ATPase
VTLVGVPGIGKSRLVAELFQRIGEIPELIRWRQGRALPYEAGVSFWALGEMVKAQAGINENDSPEAALEKLTASVAQTIEEADRPWV